MLVPCTAVLYDSTTATRTLKLSATPLGISCGIHLISLRMMSSLVRGLFSQTVFQVRPQKTVRRVEILGFRMASGYRFDPTWVCPMGSYAWGIQVFCSRNKAPSHFLNRTLEYLRHSFPCDRLILRQTDNPWLSYSQDLNPPDYLLWGYLKDRVCENNPQTRQDIIRKEIRRIPQEILDRVVDNFNVWVAAVLSYSSAVHGTNIVLITEKV